MKRTHRWKMMYSLVLICMAIACTSITAKAATTEVTIYGLDSAYTDTLSIPADLPQSYQINVGATGVTYSVFSGSSVKVSETGLVTPRYTYWKDQGYYSTSVPEGQEYDYYTLNEGETTIVATTASTSYTFKVMVVDYSTIYCDQVMDAYIAKNITEDMTDYELMQAICRFPASYDYSPYYSSVNSMILNGGGDCWASTSAIIGICEKLGIEAWSRNGNKDGGAGSGHMNAMAELNGNYYELEAGYAMAKGEDGYRPYDVTLRTTLFSYYTSNGNAIIYQYDGKDTTGSLVIPEKVDNYTVTGLGETALIDADFSSITLPDTLTSIGDFAFSTCKNLTSIEIPATVTSIGANPFTNCTKLTNITIASGNTAYKIVDQVIYTADGATLVMCPLEGTVTIPDTVTEIAEYAFYYNPNIETLVLPSSVTTIGEGGISTCTKLKSIEIEGNGLTTIATHGLRNNSALTKITLPASLESVGAYAFASCNKLKKVIFQGNAPTFGETIDGKFYDYVFFNCAVNAYYPDGNSTWTGDAVGSHGGDVVWAPVSKAPKEDESESGGTQGDGSKEDSPATKEYYHSKTGITISVVEGEKTATLVSLKKSKAKGKVTIPNTVKMNGVTYTITAIGKNAFKGNKKITSVKLGNKIKVIEANAFSGCSKLKSVTIGKNVTTIGDKAFYKCKKLTKITIPSKVSKIGKQAFAGCRQLKNITIKTKKLTLSNVGKNAFKGIHSKATIKVPEKKLAAYKTLLKKKGVGKKVKIKK